jgi:hypothetical protein
VRRICSSEHQRQFRIRTSNRRASWRAKRIFRQIILPTHSRHQIHSSVRDELRRRSVRLMVLVGAQAMNRHTAAQLQGIVASLGEHIDVLRACGLPEARQLLSIAKLDLQMRIYGISDEELHAFCAALERQHRARVIGKVLKFAPRPKDNKSTG